MARTVADILDGAAVHVSQPGKWQQYDFRDWNTNECCAAGAIAYATAPWDVHGDPLNLSTGNGELADLSRDAAEFFAEYLIDHCDADRCYFGDDELHPSELDVIETIAGWNDDGRRTQSEVVSALRDAAADWRSRFERTAA